MNKAVPFEPDPEYKVKSLIRHGFREANYFQADGWVMIVVNDALATMFHLKKKRKYMWRGY
jgi:hypothetical protein